MYRPPAAQSCVKMQPKWEDLFNQHCVLLQIIWSALMLWCVLLRFSVSKNLNTHASSRLLLLSKSAQVTFVYGQVCLCSCSGLQKLPQNLQVMCRSRSMDYEEVVLRPLLQAGSESIVSMVLIHICTRSCKALKQKNAESD